MEFRVDAMEVFRMVGFVVYESNRPMDSCFFYLQTLLIYLGFFGGHVCVWFPGLSEYYLLLQWLVAMIHRV